MAIPYHEPEQSLSEHTRDLHRALTSLKEEIEAVDWYQQRADVTPDAELKAVLIHNRNEEIEHACMVLEWLRRNSPDFDEHLRTYLFTEAPITEVEEQAEAGEDGDSDEGGSSGGGSAGGLNIGSLKQ
jgi:hypothetical protein